MNLVKNKAQLAEKPLVSFVLFAYNQSSFIREAIEGAFSQTYSNLEIILSDDCSTDDTFQIMQAVASEYSGPHRLILNRNVDNTGIGGHINKCMELSSGELIIIAAGDDVSLPERTEKTVEHWQNKDRQYMSIYTDAYVIDESGHVIEEREKRFPSDPVRMLLNSGRVLGCSHAWDRQLFTKFGPLMDNLTYEDRALPFRALLLGEVLKINEPLVKYRLCDSHWRKGDSLSREDSWRRDAIHYVELWLITYKQMIADYQTWCSDDDKIMGVLSGLRAKKKLELSLLKKEHREALRQTFSSENAKNFKWHIKAWRTYAVAVINATNSGSRLLDFFQSLRRFAKKTKRYFKQDTIAVRP